MCEAIVAALALTDPRGKVLLSLARNKDVECRIKSSGHISAMVNRHNILFLKELVFLEQAGSYEIRKLDKLRVEVSVREGLLISTDIQPLIMITDSVLAGNIKLTYLNENRVIAKAERFQLEGPIELVGQAVSEIFSEQYYSEVDIAGKVVVDIGGFIGDSALFFLSKGAKRVYVFEPFEEYYLTAKNNLSAYQNAVIENYGIGCQDTAVTLDGEVTAKVSSTTGKKAFLKSFDSAISSILEKEGEIGLLKIDCEGCEWEILNCWDSSLFSKIEAVYAELHGGDHSKFFKALLDLGFILKQSKQLPWTKFVTMYYFLKKSAKPSA